MVGMTCLSLALAAATAAAPAPGANAPAHRAVADSDVVLTAGTLKQLTTFWTSFSQEPDSIKQTGRKAHQTPLSITVNAGGKEQSMSLPGVVDMASMAGKYPAVAADLKKAGLTGEQWNADRKAFLGAAVTVQVKGSPAATSALGKNVALLTSDTADFDALKKAGMWIPPVQMGGGMGGGGDDDLNP